MPISLLAHVCALFCCRYAHEFGQTESANILAQFMDELDRRNAAILHADDLDYHELRADDDEDIPLPPLGPGVGGTLGAVYNDPEPHQYALPIASSKTFDDNVRALNHTFSRYMFSYALPLATNVGMYDMSILL